MLLCVPVPLFSQTATGDPGTFALEGVSFDYPSGWKLTDKSKDDEINVTLTLAGKSTMLVLTSPRIKVKKQDRFLAQYGYDIVTRYSGITARALGNSVSPIKSKQVCVDFRERSIAGTDYIGKHYGKAATGTLFSFMVENKIINLVYLRTDDESEEGDAARDLLLSTLRINGETEFKSFFDFNIDDDVQNGKAVKLVRPRYPKTASSLRRGGYADIKVVIDERGKVVYALAVRGDPLFFRESVIAAKDSKFEASRACGSPIKTVGIIRFNFGRRNSDK